MATQIGEGVIKVTADASGVAGAMAQVRADAKATGDSVGKAMAEGSKNATRGLDAYIAKLQQSAAAVGKSAREIKIQELANRGATAAQLAAADAALATVEAYKQQQAVQRQAAQAATAAAAAQTAAAVAAAKGASGYFQLAQGQKLSAYQAQQLSFQLNDLFVQIASGQSPITALIQQGSQLNGQFGGLGGTMRALAQAFTLTRVAIGGILGVVAGVGFAMAKGAQQSADFAKALTLTGNAAGITEGRFNASAQAIATATSTTIGSTRETLQALVASGKLSGNALDGAARATQGLSRVTGQETGKIIDQFVQLTGNVAKGAEDLNAQYNFLTATQLRYIKTLEDQGESQRALQVLFDALNGRIDATAQNLGFLERAWGGVKRAASGAVEAMLQFGRDKTAEDRIASIQAQIKALDERRSTNPAIAAQRRAVLVEELASESKRLLIGDKVAVMQAAAIEKERARTEFFKIQDQYLTNAEKREKEIARVNALAKKGDISEVERLKQIANINAKLKDDKGPASTDRQDAKAGLLLRLEDIKTTGAAIVEAFANAERVLEAKKSASLISDEVYYAEKNNLVAQQAQFQIETLQKVNAELTKQTFKGRDAQKDSLDRDREVAKNQGEISKLRAATATQTEVLAIQEQAAYRKVATAILEARAAAQSYFDLTQRGYEAEIANAGRGSRAREFDQARRQIEERYEAQRQALAGDLRRQQITKDQYERELAIINEFQQKSLASYKSYFDRLAQLQADWSLGADEALINYYETARDTAGQVEKLFTNAFEGAEDALTKFITTGKLDFRSLVNSINADLARIYVKQQITGPLSQMLQSGGSGGGFLGNILGSIFGRSSSGEGQFLTQFPTTLPMFAEGADFVPYDMIAGIHKGERIVPAAENAANGGGRNISVTINPPAGMDRRSSGRFAADVARELRIADDDNN